MRGVRGSKVQDVDHRILVINWLRRRGVVVKEEGGEKQKNEQQEK